MAVGKSRKQKHKDYEYKYGHIPIDLESRLNYMIDTYHISEDKMNQILLKRDAMMSSLYYYDYKVIELLEEPEGASRPKVRILPSNYNKIAATNRNMVHVYVPGAGDDWKYMHELTETELYQIDSIIYTPVEIEYNMFLKTPSYFNSIDTFLSEIGVIRPTFSKPDWDNAGKKYCDMFNANIWLDDTIVVDGAVRKWYSILPRVEIKLRYLNGLYTKKQFDILTARKQCSELVVPYLDNKGEMIYGE